MPRRKASERVEYAINVAFDKKQQNLTEVLTRLNEKVNRKEDASNLTSLVQVQGDQDAILIDDIQNQINQLQDAGAVMPTDQITATGASTYTVGFDMTSDSEANYDVSINGLVQDPLSDYTIDLSANTLTFGASPTVGADIVITQRDTSTFDAEKAINDFLAALQ